MQRPDVEEYQNMAYEASDEPWEWRGWDLWAGEGLSLNTIAQSVNEPEEDADCRLIAASKHAILELTLYIDGLETLIRDWLAACPETCGQCEHVHKAAEEVVR